MKPQVSGLLWCRWARHWAQNDRAVPELTGNRQEGSTDVASVEKYRDSEGRERFAARWRHGTSQMKARRGPDGQPFKSKRAAQQYADAQEADARRGLTPIRSDATVGEYAAYWLTTRKDMHRPTTKERLKYTHKHFEATGLAERRLIDVRHSHVQTWVSDRAQVLAPSTLSKVLGDLGAVFSLAAHDNVIVKSPIARKNLQMPEPGEFERITPLSVPQVEALAAAMPARYRAMPIVQAGTGVRVGELLGLTEYAFDYEEQLVHITEQRTRKEPQKRSELKTRSSKRSVPLTDRVAGEVARHLAAGYGNGVDLFTTSTGSVPHASHYGGMVTTAARKAGLSCPVDCTKRHVHVSVSSHDLRHHYATELLNAGFSTVAVGELLGHKDGTLVEKVYGHSTADTSDRARQALNRLWREDDEAA
jgi:integrase